MNDDVALTVDDSCIEALKKRHLGYVARRVIAGLESRELHERDYLEKIRDLVEEKIISGLLRNKVVGLDDVVVMTKDAMQVILPEEKLSAYGADNLNLAYRSMAQRVLREMREVKW